MAFAYISYLIALGTQKRSEIVARASTREGGGANTVYLLASQNALVVVSAVLPQIMRTSVATKWWFSKSSLISSPFPNYQGRPGRLVARLFLSPVICKCVSAARSVPHPAYLPTPLIRCRPPFTAIFHWAFHGEIIDRATKREGTDFVSHPPTFPLLYRLLR